MRRYLCDVLTACRWLCLPMSAAVTAVDVEVILGGGPLGDLGDQAVPGLSAMAIFLAIGWVWLGMAVFAIRGCGRTAWLGGALALAVAFSVPIALAVSVTGYPVSTHLSAVPQEADVVAEALAVAVLSSLDADGDAEAGP